MKQPAKAPRANTATAKPKRKKNRVELDIEARARKRDNRRRGHKAGSRANPDAEKTRPLRRPKMPIHVLVARKWYHWWLKLFSITPLKPRKRLSLKRQQNHSCRQKKS